MNNNNEFTSKLKSITDYRLTNFDNDEEIIKEERLLNKLSLRKKKLHEILYNKRGINANNSIILFTTGDSNKISYTKNDFLTGKIYDCLKVAFYSKSKQDLKNILYVLCKFFQDKNNNKTEIINILSKTDSSYNIKNSIKSNYFPLAKLILEIGLNTDDKIIYIYSFNFLLHISYLSNDFCKDLATEKIIKEIYNKLIFFYPLFIQNKKINLPINELYYDNLVFLGLVQEIKAGEAESYYVGGQILSILGNLYLSADKHEIFNSINFYQIIFYLVTIFIIDIEDNEKYLKYCYDYLETLVWLLSIFLEKDDKFVVIYYEKILNIIPNILNYITALYFTEETDLLEKIIFLIQMISKISESFKKAIVELDGIKIIINLFGYLLDNNSCINDISIDNGDNVEIKITPEITDRILCIFINLFMIQSKYFENVDFSEFVLVFEKLFDIYKLEHNIHYNIQKNLLKLLTNIACLNNIDILVNKIFLNRNIINNLFKYYNQCHKVIVLVFIDNIMVKQDKKVREFVLDMGGFDTVKSNICDCSSEKDIFNYSIKTLFDIIKEEKAFNIRLLFEKIYNTPIPDKIKEIAFNKDISEDMENIIKSLVLDFEKYEKSF